MPRLDPTRVPTPIGPFGNYHRCGLVWGEITPALVPVRATRYILPYIKTRATFLSLVKSFKLRRVCFERDLGEGSGFSHTW